MIGTVELKERLAAVQARKHVERGHRIDRLVETARSRGEDEDRIFWSIVHDLEEVPQTTNRQQLLELGLPVLTADAARLMSPSAVQVALRQLLDSLALVRVFFCRTNHLDDRTFLIFLLTRIIEEPVPDLPLLVGARDWVDCDEFRPKTVSGPRQAGHPLVSEALFDRDARLPRP
jgi:hypothetical protein